MRSVILMIALMLFAAPAFAVSPSQLPPQGGTNWSADPGGRPAEVPDGRSGGDDDNPTKPVPEPGTIALAAMSAAAIGGAIRRRRNQQ